jgi:hypothetical protein
MNNEQARKCWKEIGDGQINVARISIIQKWMDAYHSEQSKELVKDKERLDWLGNQKSLGVAFQLIFNPHTGSKDLIPTWSVHKTNPNHLRQAIDAAMKGTKAEVSE